MLRTPNAICSAMHILILFNTLADAGFKERGGSSGGRGGDEEKGEGAGGGCAPPPARSAEAFENVNSVC